MDERLIDGRDLDAVAEGIDLADALIQAGDTQVASEILLEGLRSLKEHGLSRLIVTASARQELRRSRARIHEEASRTLEGIGRPSDDAVLVRAASAPLRPGRRRALQWYPSSAQIVAVVAGLFLLAFIRADAKADARTKEELAEALRAMEEAVAASRQVKPLADQLAELAAARSIEEIQNEHHEAVLKYMTYRVGIFNSLEAQAKELSSQSDPGLDTDCMRLLSWDTNAWIHGGRQLSHSRQVFTPRCNELTSIWVSTAAVGADERAQGAWQSHALRCADLDVPASSVWTDFTELKSHPAAVPERMLYALPAPWKAGACKIWELESWTYLENIRTQEGELRPFGLSFSSPSLYALGDDATFTRVVDHVYPTDQDFSEPFVLAPASQVVLFDTLKDGPKQLINEWTLLGAGQQPELRRFPDLDVIKAAVVGNNAALTAVENLPGGWTELPTRRISMSGDMTGPVIYFHDQGGKNGIPLPQPAVISKLRAPL